MLDACVAPANEIEEGLVSRESALFSCQADQQAVSLRPCLRRPSTRSVSRETAGCSVRHRSVPSAYMYLFACNGGQLHIHRQPCPRGSENKFRRRIQSCYVIIKGFIINPPLVKAQRVPRFSEGRYQGDIKGGGGGSSGGLEAVGYGTRVLRRLQAP
jgi:hypothetical protein